MHSRQALRIPLLAALALAFALAVATIANGAPALQITSGPDGPDNDPTPTFEFEVGVEATVVECSVDQGTANYGPCTAADEHTAPPLSDGSWTFRVRASDASADPPVVVTRSFIVDTVAPSASVTSGPSNPNPTHNNAPAFGFSAEVNAAVVCSVDQGSPSYGPCSGAGIHTPATLTDGAWTFRVRPTDAAGNTGSAATRAFTVDTVAPETSITSTALGTTDDQSPSFTFSAPGAASFECRRNSEAFAPCTSPKPYAGLAEGAHTFEVRATDAAGNTDLTPASEPFTIDLTNPTLAIVDGPTGATNETQPEFEFDAEGGTTVACSLDQGTPSFGPCTSSSTHAASSDLLDGAYFFRVRARDGVTPTPHETIEVQQFTVDTVEPETQIVTGPSGLVNTASPSFTFASEAGSTFECRRDAESFAPCSSPKAYANLPQGDHSFEVRATDAAGNEEASPAAASFAVDTIAPVVSIAFGPSGLTNDDSPLFEFSVSGATATACSIDKGVPAFGPCSSPTSHVVAQRLAPGAYAFRVRGTDAAGNAATATRAFTVAGPVANQPPVVSKTPRLMSPFPLVRLTGRLTRNGAKVQVLSVRAPRGAVARVTVKPKCAKGKRCPAKSGRATIGAKGRVRFKKLELSYRAGTVIEVRVSQTGAIVGKYTRFLVRRGKAPQRVDRCLKPGATRGSACPAG